MFIYNKNKYYQKDFKTIHLNDKLFNEIKKTLLTNIEYIYLSYNETLTTEYIEYLFSLNIDNVNINLLRNKNCSVQKIKYFLSLKDKIYNIAIAHNSSISEEIVAQLLQENDKDVQHSLKFNLLIE